MSQEFSAEKERLEAQIVSVETQMEELNARLAAGDNRRALIEQYTHLEHLNREMVEVLIDYIVVGKRLSGEKDPPVEIHWRDRINFLVFSIFQRNSHIHICHCAFGYSAGNFCKQGNLRSFLCDCMIVSNIAYTKHSTQPHCIGISKDKEDTDAE